MATITCVARKGVERTSIADICKEAELSAGALYVHFRNKSDLILHCLQHGCTDTRSLPNNWTALKARVLTFSDTFGLDAATVIRARLHFHAEGVQQGPFHDRFKDMLDTALEDMTKWVQAIADSGDIALRMDARQTAAAISAYVDGRLWIAIVSDRALEPVLVEISDGLDCFVVLRAHA